MNLIRELLSIRESSPDPLDKAGDAARDARAALEDAIADEFRLDKDADMVKRIAAWLADDKTDYDVEDFLYEKLYKQMPYGTQKARDGDPSTWIGDYMEREFRNELKAVWAAEQG